MCRDLTILRLRLRLPLQWAHSKQASKQASERASERRRTIVTAPTHLLQRGLLLRRDGADATPVTRVSRIKKHQEYKHNAALQPHGVERRCDEALECCSAPAAAAVAAAAAAAAGCCSRTTKSYFCWLHSQRQTPQRWEACSRCEMTAGHTHR